MTTPDEAQIPVWGLPPGTEVWELTDATGTRVEEMWVFLPPPALPRAVLDGSDPTDRLTDADVLDALLPADEPTVRHADIPVPEDSGARALWHRHLELGVDGVDAGDHRTWFLPAEGPATPRPRPLWEAACWEAQAEEALAQGSRETARRLRLAAHRAVAALTEGKGRSRQIRD